MYIIRARKKTELLVFSYLAKGVCSTWYTLVIGSVLMRVSMNSSFKPKSPSCLVFRHNSWFSLDIAPNKKSRLRNGRTVSPRVSLLAYRGGENHIVHIPWVTYLSSVDVYANPRRTALAAANWQQALLVSTQSLRSSTVAHGTLANWF